MVLENRQVFLRVDDATGFLTELRDKIRSRSWILPGPLLPPFQTVREGDARAEAFTFSCGLRDSALSLVWRLEGACLAARIRLEEDGIRFRCSLVNAPDTCVKAVEYPILGPLALHGPRSFLAHSYATGVLFQDPAACLPQEGGLRHTPYPESFSGASMQFLSCYEEGQGGLYFAAYDPKGRQKWLNAYTRQGDLVLSHMTGFTDVREGSLLRMDYDVLLSFTSGEGWTEAAERYRDWAWSQPWCRRGPARLRPEGRDWLRRGVGYCSFGVNAGHDRSRWLRRYREDIGVRGFHVLGPDWTRTPQTFGEGIPGDLEDWIPTRFNRETLDTIRSQGDRFAPFEFDFLVSLGRSNPARLIPHLQRFPSPSFSHDGYCFTMLCPASPFTRDFHRLRDTAVVRESGADAMYYDISANNLIKVCLAENHGHPPGGGSELARAYGRVYEDTARALREESGRPVLLGTEMINELCLPQIDFYQARAWAQPASTLETWPFRSLMQSGRARMIPMFDYVYHESGITRMDGWGKLVRETGELFYHIVARVFLWGGLYEINHEYSPMEALDAEENPAAEHYARFSPRGYAYAPERAAYLGTYARLRTGAGNRFLACGRMLPPPCLDSPEISLDWYHYNHSREDPSYEASGTALVPAVLSSAYDDGEGARGVFLANTDRHSHRITLKLTLPQLRLPEGAYALLLHAGFDGEGTLTVSDLGRLDPGGRALSLDLAPRTPVLLEIK